MFIITELQKKKKKKPQAEFYRISNVRTKEILIKKFCSNLSPTKRALLPKFLPSLVALIHHTAPVISLKASLEAYPSSLPMWL